MVFARGSAVSDNPFKGKKPRFDRFIPFGFTRFEGGYVYSAPLAGGQLELRVTATDAGALSDEITDAATGEPYVLHRVSGAQGAFVGEVRAACERVLAAIVEACFENDSFSSEGAGAIIRYVESTYGDTPEFLWKKFPGNAILRRQDNAKWYAALLTVARVKLGLSGEGTLEIIDLRIDPAELPALLDGSHYLPGYHMNKKHWFTIVLDGSVPVEEIFRRIDASYALASKK